MMLFRSNNVLVVNFSVRRFHKKIVQTVFHITFPHVNPYNFYTDLWGFFYLISKKDLTFFNKNNTSNNDYILV